MIDITSRSDAEVILLNLLNKYLVNASDTKKIMDSVYANSHCIPMRYVHQEFSRLPKKSEIEKDDKKILNELLDIYG